MPSTYLSLHYHIIFATKDRRPWFDVKWRGRMHGYLGGAIRDMGGVPQIIGGVEDHVHMLIGLRATHCLADVMRELKKNASLWAHKEIGQPYFGWQEGYAAFSVSPTARDGVRQYIENQEEHHRKESFREELVALLKRAGVEYDPKYFE